MGPEVLDRPLSLNQLKELVKVQPGVTLVGGQAVAFWADYYNALDKGFEAGLTKDLDFFGTRDQAKAHIVQLKAAFPLCVRFEIATIDTPPPSAAVILIDNFHGQKEPMVIDYVSAMAGYELESEKRMLKQAVNIFIDDVTLKCMHPFDCVKSRIHNLALLPAKRTELGIEQCKTAIRAARAMLTENSSGDWNQERQVALRMAEALISLAAHRHSLEVRRLYGIDVMQSIDSSTFCDSFKTIRWPRALKYIDDKFTRMSSRY